VKHYDPDAGQYAPNFLYAAPVSVLLAQSETLNYTMTYLCVNDTVKVPEELRQHDFKLILIDGKYHIEYVFNRILDLYDDLRRWDMDMHIHSLKGKPPQFLIDISERVIEYPMIIFDASFNVLAYTKHIDTDYDLFNETIKNGYSSPEIISTLEKTHLFQQLYSKSEPVVLRSAGSDKMTNIYLKITGKDTILAYASIFCGYATPEQGYIDLMKRFFENLSLYFRQSFHAQKSSNYMYETFLHELLSNKDISLQKIEQQLQYIGSVPFSAYFKLIKIDFGSDKSVPLVYVAREIGANILKSRPFIFESELYILREFSEPEKAKDTFSDEELNILGHILDASPYALGASGMFRQITMIRAARVQCDAALKYRNCRQHSNLFEYENIMLQHIIELASKEYSVSAALCQDYIVLKEFDAANGTDYCSFLKAFLQNERNTTKTSAELFLHRNTVIYKMKKIEEILHCDFECAKTRENMIFSYIIQDYLDEIDLPPENESN
jgi:sugar diacid utilization regulator